MMNEYHYVGHIYHGHMFFEGKVRIDDHFLVIDEYERPEVLNQVKLCCLLLNIRTGETHEVYASRLKNGPHYKRVA